MPNMFIFILCNMHLSVLCTECWAWRDSRWRSRSPCSAASSHPCPPSSKNAPIIYSSSRRRACCNAESTFFRLHERSITQLCCVNRRAIARRWKFTTPANECVTIPPKRNINFSNHFPSNSKKWQLASVRSQARAGLQSEHCFVVFSRIFNAQHVQLHANLSGLWMELRKMKASQQINKLCDMQLDPNALFWTSGTLPNLNTTLLNLWLLPCLDQIYCLLCFGSFFSILRSSFRSTSSTSKRTFYLSMEDT